MGNRKIKNHIKNTAKNPIDPNNEIKLSKEKLKIFSLEKEGPKEFSSQNNCPMLTVCMVGLLCGGYAYSRFAQRSKEVNHSQDLQQYKKFCSNKGLATVNKPPIVVGKVTFIGKDSTYIPNSCFNKGAEKQCKKESEEINLFEKNLGFLNFLESEVMGQYHSAQGAKFFKTFLDQFIKIDQIKLNPDTFSDKYKEELKVINALGYKKEILNRVKTVITTNQSICNDHTAVILLRLLTQKNPETLKVQRVHLSITKGSAYEGHSFVMLNSNQADIDISKNSKQVFEFLQKLEGTICDSWNEGQFTHTKENTVLLYKPDHGWASLTLSTISLEYDFHAFSSKMKTYLSKLNKELNDELFQLADHYQKKLKMSS